MRRTFFVCGIATMALTFGGCSDYFEVDTNDILLDKDYVKESNELYSGYMGVASKMQAIADQTVFLSDLRTDLLEPTVNAPQDLWDLYNFKEKPGNSFANPRPYYDLIVNANAYLSKIIAYRKNNPTAIEEAHYQALISGTIRFKVWTYLTLGKLYGQVAYFDDPDLNLDKIGEIPVIGFDELIPRLIALMESGVDGVNGLYETNWGNILYPGVPANEQDLVWNMICPSPAPLRMELYLWNKDYQRVVDVGIPFIYDNGGRRYKVDNQDYNGEWIQVFTRDPITKTRVLINIVPYDFERNQTNRLISFFSNQEPSLYYLKPTEVAMQRHASQLRYDGHTLGDQYRGENYTYFFQNGQWVIRKFSRDRESASEIYKNNVHIVIYRDSDVHFFLIEALNNLGKFSQAEALLNDGIEQYVIRNVGNLQAPFDDEVMNAELKRNWGIRRRVNLGPVFPQGLSKEDIDTEAEKLEYMEALDRLVAEETLMESAGEAKAYFALMRIAKRWNDPSILADIVSAKYPDGQKQQVRGHLMNEQNWFVQYPL
ncbi:RagB/SusD family nutrient uptake outer membrane protein [Sphingobacterium sp. FBM7-1]|uniref:RagB/SusD family nutrient uptake outer membrane protein n=1 Tax=Sphingobacterium sp. FBM7-1 TaxID=2886688 RepID=UPI001D11FD04|nr:RagB/SusD family nutrient uptake outer membrane protein [Sphingobacterium sp. FBM7-1]MCC2598975.1 RagB/SusD family nutrient uptake outer membrane protein [Sphingobacterium sp. FBM7-1]